MKKILASLAIALGSTVFAGSLSANFTLFDVAKDSMNIVRGEFVELERTNKGDRLTLRCDKVLKGSVSVADEIVIEPFEISKADAALGRDVIVGFNEINGEFTFTKAPYAWRSFYFEETDPAPNGLDMNEQALKAFVAINAPHKEEIEAELRKRLEYQDAGYEGIFEEGLIEAWKVELLSQMNLKGSWAARDAAKAVVDHELFKGKLTVAEVQEIGALLPEAQIGTLGRAYMIEAIRHEVSAYPSREALIQMVREETSQSVVGKLAGLLSVDEDRAAVIEAIGSIITEASDGTNARVNAMQVALGLKDVTALPHVHAALQNEMGSTFDKDVVRAALKTMRAVPSEDSTSVLETYMESSQFANSWELRQRAVIAYACIDSKHTNAKLKTMYLSEENPTYRKFLLKMLDTNKDLRLVYMVHKED
ncbi:MAG: hypothetical protein ACYTDT_08505 [Planctomycetota bacterium]|jgi:hypothetical protein